MKVVLFGASGMVGAGALRELVVAPEVEAVLVIGRQPCGFAHAKVRELLLPDLFAVESVESQLGGYDACLWAIGVSSVGLSAEAYARITEELTLTWARALLSANPQLAFCYCSAAGAGGWTGWAKVRQRVEGTLKALPFKYSGVVRPAFIRPAPGVGSRTPLYQAGLVLARPFMALVPFFVRVLPSVFTTSEALGRAMLRVCQGRADRYILESTDINRVGA